MPLLPRKLKVFRIFGRDSSERRPDVPLTDQANQTTALDRELAPVARSSSPMRSSEPLPSSSAEPDTLLRVSATPEIEGPPSDPTHTHTSPNNPVSVYDLNFQGLFRAEPDTRTSQGWETFKTALRVLHGGADVFPPLKGAVGGLLVLIEKCEKPSKNREQLATITRMLLGLSKLLENIRDENQRKGYDTLPDNVKDRLNGLTKIIELQLSALSLKLNASKVERIILGEKHAEDLAASLETISSLMQIFLLDFQVHTTIIIEEVLANQLWDSLPRAPEASFRAGDRPRCLRNTRTEILADLSSWAVTNDRHPGRVYWMNGIAGTGKTTIAQSFSELLAENGVLGASFFCSNRASAECADVKRIIPTISYALARVFPPYARALLAALRHDRDIAYHSLDRQFMEMMVKPLSKAVEATSHMPNHLGFGHHFIVVIDALDECSDSDATQAILSLILMHDIPILRFFVASRPEPHIHEHLATLPGLLRLHDVENDIIRHDISLYLRNGLAGIASKRKYSDWPSDWALRTLSERAGKLFIYASTTVRYLSDAPDPKQRLVSLLGRSVSSNSLLMKPLDALYVDILERAFENLDDEETLALRQLLGFLCKLSPEIPFRPRILSKLFGWDEALPYLRRFSSVLNVPLIEDSDEEVHIFHASFADFITDRERISHLQRIQFFEYHDLEMFFAKRSLNYMNQLMADPSWFSTITGKIPIPCNGSKKAISSILEVNLPPLLAASIEAVGRFFDAPDIEVVDMINIFIKNCRRDLVLILSSKDLRGMWTSANKLNEIRQCRLHEPATWMCSHDQWECSHEQRYPHWLPDLPPINRSYVKFDRKLTTCFLKVELKDGTIYEAQLPLGPRICNASCRHHGRSRTDVSGGDSTQASI